MSLTKILSATVLFASCAAAAVVQTPRCKEVAFSVSGNETLAGYYCEPLVNNENSTKLQVFRGSFFTNRESWTALGGYANKPIIAFRYSILIILTTVLLYSARLYKPISQICTLGLTMLTPWVIPPWLLIRLATVPRRDLNQFCWPLSLTSESNS